MDYHLNMIRLEKTRQRLTIMAENCRVKLFCIYHQPLAVFLHYSELHKCPVQAATSTVKNSQMSFDLNFYVVNLSKQGEV